MQCIWLLVTDCFAIVPFSLHPHCLLLAVAGVERQQARRGGAGCGCFQLSFPRGACPSGEQSVQAGPVNTTGTSASRTPPHPTPPTTQHCHSEPLLVPHCHCCIIPWSHDLPSSREPVLNAMVSSYFTSVDHSDPSVWHSTPAWLWHCIGVPCHSAAVSQCCRVTVLQCHSAAVSQCCSVTVLPCRSAAVSQCCRVAVLQCHSAAVSQCCSVISDRKMC